MRLHREEIRQGREAEAEEEAGSRKKKKRRTRETTTRGRRETSDGRRRRSNHPTEFFFKQQEQQLFRNAIKSLYVEDESGNYRVTDDQAEIRANVADF